MLSDRATFEVLLTSLAIAIPRTLLALLLATAFAWCIARTNIPCKRVLEGLLVFMFFLPELPWILAWMLLGAPNVGLLNQWLGALVSGGEGLINVYSYAGLIVLGAVRSATVLFLFIHPAFLAMDATLEEAARMAGASGWRTLWRINLPLLMPVRRFGHPVVRRGMELFEIPQLLDIPPNIVVFTTPIDHLAYGGHVANFVPRWCWRDPAGAARRSDRRAVAAFAPLLHDSVGPRFNARPIDLGHGRWIAFGAVLAVLRRFRCHLRPFVVLLLNSFSGVEAVHQLGDVHDDASEQRARSRTRR